MSRTTVTKFFSGVALSDGSFLKLCRSLQLNWEQISSEELALGTEKDQVVVSTHSNESLIEQLKEHCRQKILKQYSRMRLLSGEEIGVNQLYVDVWLLEKPEHRHFNTSENLLSKFDMAKDRLALSKRIRRNSGFEIANSKSKLIILGKPGSGKTTFIKHLAVDWCEGKFQPEQIAILIELRQIENQMWNFVEAISQELGIKKEKVLDLLEQGQLLILMDGLDEVSTDELRRNVQSQVKKISEKYSDKNRFVLTCRTQIIGIIPNGFSSVEVASFSPEQVRSFVQNWFATNGQSKSEVVERWETVQSAITKQPSLRELTATPVLLSLICVVLQDNGNIPENRTNLYKRGISWLLSRWNNEKKIKAWELGTDTYRTLSVEEKEALLIEIAARKFENPKNFVLFEQDELVSYISQKLQLANAQEGISVLRAIEAQHGLLIERADELWSFSHLTFQEYFTVQWLTQLPAEELAEKIENLQWQRAVEQLVKSQQPADRLFRLIKQAIDQIIVQESAVQTFLHWLSHKANSFQAEYDPAVVRAFYYSLTFSLDRDRARDRDRALDPDLIIARDLARDRDRDLAIAIYLPRTLDYDLTIDRALDVDHAFNLDLDLTRALALARSIISALDHARLSEQDYAISTAIALDPVRAIDLNRAINLSRQLNLASDFISGLCRLEEELPDLDDPKEIQVWWPLNGHQWIDALQQAMLDYRNIGHDWKFSHEQQKKLQCYYETNKFLIDLMKIKGAISDDCRAEVESVLLLPWTELSSH